MNKVDKRRRAAVHDRDFRMIELDDDVVDPQADKSREQVLNCLNRAILERQPSRVLNAAEMCDDGGNFKTAEVCAPEANAVVCWRRLQRQRDLLTGMKTDSGAGYSPFEGALCVHL